MGALSMDFLYRVVYPNTAPATAINKMHPDCLKLAAIVRKSKFKIATNTANDVINKDDRNASDTPFTQAGIGDFERLYQEDTPAFHNPNGWLWTRVSDQVLAKSLEWIPWAKS